MRTHTYNCSQRHANTYVQLFTTPCELIRTTVHNAMRTHTYNCSQRHANTYVQLFTTPCEHISTTVHNAMRTHTYNCSQRHTNTYVQLFTTPCEHIRTTVHNAKALQVSQTEQTATGRKAYDTVLLFVRKSYVSAILSTAINLTRGSLIFISESQITSSMRAAATTQKRQFSRQEISS